MSIVDGIKIPFFIIDLSLSKKIMENHTFLMEVAKTATPPQTKLFSRCRSVLPGLESWYPGNYTVPPLCSASGLVVLIHAACYSFQTWTQSRLQPAPGSKPNQGRQGPGMAAVINGFWNDMGGMSVRDINRKTPIWPPLWGPEYNSISKYSTWIGSCQPERCNAAMRVTQSIWHIDSNLHISDIIWNVQVWMFMMM